jgi:hypothetical protein
MPTTANVLTGLMPTFFRALNMVNNEKTDAIDAVTLNSDLAQAVVGQTITYPIAAPKSLYDITPQANPLDINGDTAGTGTMQISYSKAASFKWTGEEQRQLQLGGISQYYADQSAQCIRAIRNYVESLIVTTAAVNACRAVGTPGTTPFAFNGTTISGMENFADSLKEMEDNGSPDADIHMILGTKAAAGARKIPNLFKANEAGTDRMLRTGAIGQIEGFNVGVSPQIKTKHVIGASTGNVLNGAAAAGPFTTPQVIAIHNGTGAINVGDLVIFASDTTRTYVVLSATGGATPTSITIAAPGLSIAGADGDAVTVVGTGVSADNFISNLFFSRDAIHLVARQPMLPVNLGGTATGVTGAVGTLIDCKLLPDPRSKLVYQIAAWAEHRQITIEFGLAFGVGVPNPQNLFLLVG